MKERIRAIMESKKMTQQEFSQFLEMSPASLSSIFTGRTKPTLNVVELIKNKFDNINLEWLMFGNGPMFNSDENTDENAGDENTDENYAGTDEGYDSVSDASYKDKTPYGEYRNGSTQEIRNSASPYAMNAEFYDMKNINNIRRKIKEIRVFYDDQTYESFVPRE